MPRRKQELYDERRLQIIDGALKVFAGKGFTDATNKDIATAAQINSPGLIYHYFADKAALLRAVIEHYAPPMQLLAQTEMLMTLPPEQALARFGQAYLQLMDDPKIGACLRVLMGEAMRSPKFAEILGEHGPLRFWKLIATYLQRKMDEGVLQRTDPMIAARCFVGPLVTYVLGRNIIQMSSDTYIDGQLLLTTHIGIFLHGLQRTESL